MSYIRYKRFGKKEYAYEITSYWDPFKKKPRQKVKYIGVVIDKNEGVFEKKGVSQKEERLILDFGDTYILLEFMKKIKLTETIEIVFGNKTKELLALICYRLSHPGAMNYGRVWLEGNIGRVLLKDVNISSQRISNFFQYIGDERLQRDFFRHYISSLSNKGKGVIIDTTALANQINLGFNAWGYNDGGIDKQIRFLFVVDRSSSLPLYFRYLPGNIVDVSSLTITIEELKKFGIEDSFVLIDGGFFSEENIKSLYSSDIEFLTRLPSSRVLYRELIKEVAGDLEKFKNVTRYGKRVLFIKQKGINLYGRGGYAYIVLDPERRGREIKRYLIDVMEEDEVMDEEEIEYSLMKQGIMILISSFKIENKEILPLYYLRQTAERLFGFSKDDLKLIPLRVHKEETLRGYLLFIFISLVVFLLLKKEIGEKYTVEEILMNMKNLKCKVYDNEIFIQELSKQQREIVEVLNILVPKKLGI